MTRNKWLIPLSIFGVMLTLVLIGIGIFVFSGNQITVARCIVSTNGSVFMVYDDRPVKLNYGNETDFQTGDKLMIVHQGTFAESDPEQTKAYVLLRLEKGDRSDVPTAVLLHLTELGYLTSFVSEEQISFSLTFGTYGISSYDSKTGRLVKTTDATHPEDYVTTMFFNEEELCEIYALLANLDLRSYPDVYDPVNDPNEEIRYGSDPSMDIILTVTTNTWSKTVTCENVGYGAMGYDAASQAFLDVYTTLKEKITSTEEWKALPDYEFLYS